MTCTHELTEFEQVFFEQCYECELTKWNQNYQYISTGAEKVFDSLEPTTEAELDLGAVPNSSTADNP